MKVLRQATAGTQTTEIDLTQLSSFERNNLIIVPGDVVYIPAKNGKLFDRKAPSVLGIASIVSTTLIFIRLFL